MTSVLKSRRKERHRERGEAMLRKQGLELYSHKPRNNWNHHKLEEARKDSP